MKEVNMQIIHVHEEMPSEITKSIFLLGAEKRPGTDAERHNPEYKILTPWRTEFLRSLEKSGYDGTVFIHEQRDKFNKIKSPTGQSGREWEQMCIHSADIPVFWLDRNPHDMMGPTSNIEYGLLSKRPNLFVGWPSNTLYPAYVAKRNKYIADECAINDTRTYDNIRQLTDNIVATLGNGEKRTGHAARIPLIVYQQPFFKDWFEHEIAYNNDVLSVDVPHIEQPHHTLFRTLLTVQKKSGFDKYEFQLERDTTEYTLDAQIKKLGDKTRTLGRSLSANILSYQHQKA